jgi:predicted PilT family ATPase
MKELIEKCSSLHLFPSGKVIFKFPLGKTENVVKRGKKEEIEKIISSSEWRVINADGVLHAVKNPTKNISTVIPKKLPVDGKFIIFGETGAGKSTFLSTLGRQFSNVGKNVFTIESPKTLSLQDATRLENTEQAVTTVLLCRPDVILFDEIRERKHYKQLKDLSLACQNIIGSLHATDIFEAIARFASLNGERTYGEVSTMVDRFVHIENGQIVNWYFLKTTLSSQLRSEFHADGERPVTTVYDKNNAELGWVFYFANDINIVKATPKHEKVYFCPSREENISDNVYNDCHECDNCDAKTA